MCKHYAAFHCASKSLGSAKRENKRERKKRKEGARNREKHQFGLQKKKKKKKKRLGSVEEFPKEQFLVKR